MRITAISDLHGYFPKLDGGDLLIIAGDLTGRDTLIEHSNILEWINEQDYKKKIVIAGNHDHLLQNNPNFYSKTDIEYLCDSGTEFEGLKIWGMPWSLTFEGINPKCTAFTCAEDEMKEKVELIPEDTDILISHGPPFGILDNIPCPIPDGSQYHCGSKNLEKRIRRYLDNLRAVIFGHIHENGGKILDTSFYYPIAINASIVDERYRHIHKPVEIEI